MAADIAPRQPTGIASLRPPSSLPRILVSCSSGQLLRQPQTSVPHPVQAMEGPLSSAHDGFASPDALPHFWAGKTGQ